MLGIDLNQPVLWDSWVNAARWDLLGMALWGSLFVSGVLTIVGIIRRSPWNLLLAAVLSLGCCGLVAFMYTAWLLIVPVAQLGMATGFAATRQMERA